MLLALLVLSVGSIWIGYMMKEMMIGVGTRYYGGVIELISGNEA